MKSSVRPLFVGIDVQERRPSAYTALDADGVSVATGWLEVERPAEARRAARRLVEELSADADRIVVGIDAPRQPLAESRVHYWDRPKRRWREARSGDKGFGRHCEVVVKALGLGNPQWTPVDALCPPWMRLGFALFEGASEAAQTLEIFPTASLSLLDQTRQPRITIDFAGFAAGRRDMLDALIGAATVREYCQGRGAFVGGGDGTGCIILPRPIPSELTGEGIGGVLEWPESSTNQARQA